MAPVSHEGRKPQKKSAPAEQKTFSDEHVTRSFQPLHKAHSIDRNWAAVTAGRLLVADPDFGQQQSTLQTLKSHGLNVRVCADGAQALYEAGRLGPDFLLLAARLPRVPTEIVVATIREFSSAPILLGIAREDAAVGGSPRVEGTIWVERPYRAETVIRRLHHATSSPGELLRRSRLRYGALDLDPAAFTTRVAGRELHLPLKEFEILRLLMLNAGEVVSSEEIMSRIWQFEKRPSSNALSVHMSRLRARLKGQASIRTLRGRGYRLTDR